MGPRTNHEPRSLGDRWRGFVAYAYEIVNLTRKKRVVPTGHEKDRRLQIPRTVLAVDLDPVGVLFGVCDPVIEIRNVPDGAVIGFDEWKTVKAGH